jgi:hypothetical protein
MEIKSRMANLLIESGVAFVWGMDGVVVYFDRWGGKI